MAGSLPRLPQRLIVRGETLKSSATSETVRRSGRFFRSRSRLVMFCGLMRCLRVLLVFDIQTIS